jgi:glycosyltransferase involved in cell wall biosynthesis
MAHGKPVVASDVGGLANLIEHGRTGLLVPSGNVGALRAAIEFLLEDVNLRRRLGAAARERIVSFYGRERVTGATLAAYLTAVDRREPSSHDPRTRLVTA